MHEDGTCLQCRLTHFLCHLSTPIGTKPDPTSPVSVTSCLRLCPNNIGIHIRKVPQPPQCPSHYIAPLTTHVATQNTLKQYGYLVHSPYPDRGHLIARIERERGDVGRHLLTSKAESCEDWLESGSAVLRTGSSRFYRRITGLPLQR